MNPSRPPDAGAHPRLRRDARRDAALAYAARGWSVIPIEPQGKRPLVGWREFQFRRADAAEVRAWFRRWPKANVGIVTGRISGLVVVDVDAQHGGFDSLATLRTQGPPLGPTVEAATGGGGRHFYFAHPGVPLANRVAVLPGIDVRADGGCVVAPPSLHPSGRLYTWLPGRAPGELPLAALPALLADAARHAERAGHPAAYWRQLIHQGIPQGQRNNTLASLTGHLLRRGVDADVTLELMLAWNRTHCRPPLSDEEVVSVVESIGRLHAREAEGPRGASPPPG